jgi:CubicO group peptidase (beta-lactamase class C family)
VSLDKLQVLLDEGVQTGVFPSAQAVVFHQGSPVFTGGAGGNSPDTRYDLASLTKVLGTTAVFLSLWSEGHLGPDTPIARFHPKSALAAVNATVGDLLFHRSGLPAWQPFYAPVMHAIPELRDPACPSQIRAEVREEVVRAAILQTLERAPGEAAVYSDVGFIVLGEILGHAAQKSLETLVRERVAGPLGLELGYHRLTRIPEGAEASPATGTIRPRELAPGQPQNWKDIDSVPSRPGEVDDDNAWVMDGVAGHAGLFGTAESVARFGQAVLDGARQGNAIAPAPLWMMALRKDRSVPGSTRALGFDTPSDEGSSAGRYLGKTAPGAVGHLGFTGTSLWVDLARGLSVALLTNRTLPGRDNLGIRDFRPRFHDAVVEALGLT